MVPDRGPLGVRRELLEVGDEQDHVEQVVDVGAGPRGHGHERHVAAVVLDDHPGLGQLVLDAVRVGVGLVDLVERDDDRHLGRAGVIDRLERLGHHAVVGGHHDHGDVGHPRPTGTHRRERLVARGVEEDDAAVALDDLARADVLRDAAPLAGGHVGCPERVEEARLAVVDVTHDGHDRGTWLEVGRVVLLEEDFLRRFGRGGLAVRVLAARGHARRDLLRDLIAELAGHERRRVAVDQLVDGREDSALDELADHVRRIHVEQGRELLDRDGPGQLDRATLARVGDLDRSRCDSGFAALWLSRATPAAGATPTPGQAVLLRFSIVRTAWHRCARVAARHQRSSRLFFNSGGSGTDERTLRARPSSAPGASSCRPSRGRRPGPRAGRLDP